MVMSSRRFIRSAVFSVFVLLATALCAATAFAGDAPERIVAVGDLHGDYGAFEDVMSRAGLIGPDGAWTGGEAVLVQMGDVAGRGSDTLKIVRTLKRLKIEAAKAGGDVIALVGNHEAMQMTGDLRYVHPGEWASYARDGEDELYTAFFDRNRRRLSQLLAPDAEDSDGSASSRFAEMEGRFRATFPPGYAGHRIAWSPTGEVGAWVVENPAAVILGDTLFVHGGLSAPYAEHTIERLNAETREALLTQTNDRSAIVRDQYGPQWYRGLNREAGQRAEFPDGRELTVEEETALVLENFGVARIVIGHTPHLEGIKPMHDGRVIQIDTGLSAYYGGARSFLEITPAGVFANDNGVVRQIRTAIKTGP